MDYSDLTETDAFYDSCRTRALHDFNDVLEQSLELTSDVMDALVRNKLISNHVRDMLNGPSLDNEAKVQGVLFNIKKNMSEDKFNRFLSVVENTGLRHIAKAIWRCYSERASVYEPKLKEVACQTENNMPTKLPARERQKLCRIYDKVQKGLKNKPTRRVYFEESHPDENSIRIEDVDREIDKLLEIFHEHIHYIGKFRNKLGLDGIELPTMSREIEKLVDRCKELETKVNNMSKNMLHSEHGNEGSSTSESSFSSAIQRPRLSGNIRTSSPFTSDLNRAFGHGPEGLGLPKRTHGKIFRDKHSELRNMEDDNEYLLSVHPKISPLSPRRNGIRTNTTKTSVIMQSHLDIYERLLLHPATKTNAQTNVSSVPPSSNNFIAKLFNSNQESNHDKKELNAQKESGKIEFPKTLNARPRRTTSLNFRRSSQNK